MDEQSQETTTFSPKSGGMSPMIIVGVIAIVILAGGYVLLSRNSQPSDSAPVTVTTRENDTSQPLAAPEVVGEEANQPVLVGDEIASEDHILKLEAGSFYYSIEEIRAKKGETIKVRLNAKDKMHDFNIDELGVKSGIVNAGESVEFEINANKAGTFEYYCSVGEHRANGQVGKLIVEE